MGTIALSYPFPAACAAPAPGPPCLGLGSGMAGPRFSGLPPSLCAMGGVGDPGVEGRKPVLTKYSVLDSALCFKYSVILLYPCVKLGVDIPISQMRKCQRGEGPAQVTQ